MTLTFEVCLLNQLPDFPPPPLENNIRIVQTHGIIHIAFLLYRFTIIVFENIYSLVH